MSALQREPIRAYMYTVLVALLAALVIFGVVDGSVVPAVLALGAAVLGIPAIEAARAQVTPVRPAPSGELA